MHIALLCATKRGYRVARLLFELGQGHDFTVFSFRETAWEPPYMDGIRDLTLAAGHRFIEARDVAGDALRSFWHERPVDLLLMVSWRYMVPREVYAGARLGSYVLHDSLLPRYRGFAPTLWAMINGEGETGVTLFAVAEEVDAGDIVEQRAITIGLDDTIAMVMDRVTGAYLAIVEDSFENLLAGTAERRPQDHSQATYTCKWTPADARIDWSQPARQIYDLIRATSQPYPGAYTCLDGQKLRIWSAELPREPRHYVSRAPGRVLGPRPDGGAAVLTGKGVIILKTVQLGSQPIVPARRLLNSVEQTLGGGAR